MASWMHPLMFRRGCEKKQLCFLIVLLAENS
jgi:hypothetical protein